MRSGILAVVVTVLISGCTPPGMNVKLASADAGCGLAVTGALEQVPDDKFDATKTKIIEIATELKGFVDTGNLGQLPLDEVKVRLEAYMVQKGWANYTYIVDAAVQWVKTQNVNVNKIGPNNVNLIKVGLEETIRNAERCTVEGKTKRK